MNVFDKSINLIQDNEKKYDLGWRFLTTSKKTISQNNGIFLITLNPGGNKPKYKGQSEASCENGSAYFVEDWGGKPGKSKLQIQIAALFEKIAENLYNKNSKELLEQSLCGYFIPFRSPDWNSLKYPKSSIAIGKRIWTSVISNSIPQIIICIDQITFKNIKEILLGLNYSEEAECSYPTGWGDYKASIAKFKLDEKKISILRLPHLSRFSIFKRNESMEQVDNIIKQITIDYKNNTPPNNSYTT